MNIRARFVSALFAVLAVGTASAAPALPIPLNAGTYVLDGAGAGAACDDVPNAGTLYFDGRNVIFPHVPHSLSTVAAISPDNRTYTIDIAEAGFKIDGAPMRGLHRIVLTIPDDEHFRLIEQAGKKSDDKFHRCGPLPKMD